MFRFTTLAMLLALGLASAVLTTGCDNKSTGSQAKSPLAPPAPGSDQKVPEQTLPKP